MDYVPFRNHTELEGSKVRRGLEVVGDAERVVELIRVDELESKHRVGGRICPGDVDFGAARPVDGNLEE